MHYEEVSQAEFDAIIAGQADLDATHGGEGESEPETSESQETSEEDKPKSRGRGEGRGESRGRSRSAPAKDEESSEGDEDEGEEDGEDEGGGPKDGDWFSTGYGESNKLTDAEAGGYDDKAWRFFLRHGEETEIVFLDDGESDKERWDRPVCAPFNVWEHNFAVVNPDDPDDVTFYDLTCVRGKLGKDGKPRRCYICERKKKIKRRFRSMFTVLSKYSGKGGKEAWSKKLLPADKAALKKIKRHSKKHGMFGMCFNVFRTEERASRIGDDWSYDTTLTEEQVQELLGERQDLAPLDYIEECRPMSWDELSELLKDAIIADPKKKGKGRRRSSRGRDDDDDRPRGRGRDDDDRGRDRDRDDDRRERSRGRDRDDDRGGDEDRPRRRGRDEERDEGSEERPSRRGRDRDDRDDDRGSRRRSSREEDSEESEDEGSSDETEESQEKEAAPASGGDEGDAGSDIPF